MSVIVALFLTISLELPDSYASSTKRQVTLILYIGPSPVASTHYRAQLKIKDDANIQKDFEL